MTKLGLFGGTFDPIHDGHIGIAKASLKIVDAVMFIPNKISPFKIKKKNYYNDNDRLNLIRKKIADSKVFNFFIDTDEISFDKVSYTIDAVNRYKKEFPDYKLYIIMGADSFNEFKKYKKYKEIIENVNIIVAERPGYKINTKIDIYKKYKKKIHIIETNFEESSTKIREKLNDNEK